MSWFLILHVYCFQSHKPYVAHIPVLQSKKAYSVFPWHHSYQKLFHTYFIGLLNIQLLGVYCVFFAKRQSPMEYACFQLYFFICFALSGFHSAAPFSFFSGIGVIRLFVTKPMQAHYIHAICSLQIQKAGSSRQVVLCQEFHVFLV